MPHSQTKRIALPGAGFKCLVVCVEPGLSPCVHLEKHTNSTNNTPIVIPKKNNVPLPAFSAEPPSQRASDETHFFNTTRATTRNLLAGFLAQPRPPGRYDRSWTLKYTDYESYSTVRLLFRKSRISWYQN